MHMDVGCPVGCLGRMVGQVASGLVIISVLYDTEMSGRIEMFRICIVPCGLRGC